MTKFDPLETGLALVGMFAVGFLVGDHSGSALYATSVREQEAACRARVAKGWVAYPVTKQGMLRGCYDVPPDDGDWKKMSHFRRLPE